MSDQQSINPTDLTAFAAPLGDDSEKKPKESKRLFGYVNEWVEELWHTPEGIPYATILRKAGHLEHHPVESKYFERGMRIVFHGQEEAPPSQNAIRDVREMLGSLGVLHGLERAIYLRTAHLEEPRRIYLDLGSKNHEAVEITAEGWRILPAQEVPVRFYRPALLGALPTPVQGGSVAALRPFLNLDEQGFVLLISWILMALWGRGPFPILTLSGEQGTAKSTISRIAQRLVDPSPAGIRGAIKDGQDLFIAAQNSHLVVLDNLSTISDKLSDDLCRLSTGGTFTARKLYTSSEEVVLTARRPILMNGIPDMMTRGDLVDRGIRITLEPVPEGKRQAEADLYPAIDAVLGEVLGGLLSALSGALARWDQVAVPKGQRMADFAKVILAAEQDLPWAPGTFLEAYENARHDLTLATLEGDTFGLRVRDLVLSIGDWEGTFQTLLDTLSTNLSPDQRTDGWPRTAKGASTALRRAAPLLRHLGFKFTYTRKNGGNRDRLVRITAPSE